MKTRSVIIEILAALLLLLFLYTAVSKINEHERFVMVLAKSPLLKQVALPVSWAVPVIEIAVSVLLFNPAWRLSGFRLSFALMLLFTLYIGYMILFTPHLPCSCGGVIRKMSWVQHLFFNVFFMAISWWGIRLEKKKLVVAITQA
ncbi:hypothetical protein LZZ85_02530 [Terrimonas sp. NA20]|uniref:Methylamine utilisation protein MauE domain-containing protein n=1 Tax=Terrimonas ginsenosidimutans TaxID=2908004 RepID=A0ABS9KLD4_9BACT|nr:MauE/DoxX family redox-associated membrane protein [Terrimonas ginsenosidimutans]MCG2613131.1 hypothetical protein [Terrimonas ginsenosidimutans]